jgi:hypothetical protein
MSEKTFGSWLLEQTERGDTTGTLARAWKQLRDARGHGRVTRAKSIGELLSGQLGEDWERLQGEQAMQLAEAEWKGDATDTALVMARAATDSGHRTPLEDVQAEFGTYGPDDSARYAVLVVNGIEVLLEAGKRYVLRMGMPEVVEEEQPPADFDPAAVLQPDGSLDWASLYGQADHTVPQDDDLVSLGLLTREEES